MRDKTKAGLKEDNKTNRAWRKIIYQEGLQMMRQARDKEDVMTTQPKLPRLASIKQ